MSGKNAILIVDDEAMILMAIKQEIMSRYGEAFQIETALDAEEGFEVIDELVQEQVDVILVISDWLMPGLKGDEFLAKVKAQHPSIHCIIISGHADPDAIARARELVNLDAYIQKPWSRQELLEAVGCCVGD